MSDYIPELYALVMIFQEQKNYREALFKVNMEEQLSQNDRHRVGENVLGVLKHYFCLSFELQDLLTSYTRDSEEFLLSLLPLFELRYHKDQDSKLISSFYKDAFLKERLTGDPKAGFDILLAASKTPFVIPEEVKKSPYLYNSLTLEFPEFLLHKLSDGASPKVALDVALSLHKKPTRFYGLANREYENILLEDKTFDRLYLNHDLVLYQTKKAVNSRILSQKGLYPVSYVEAQAYSELDIPPLEPKLLFTGVESGSQLLPLSLKLKEYYQSEVAVDYENSLSYRTGLDCKVHFNLPFVKIINSRLTLLKTYLPLDHYDLVVNMGKDTKVGLASRIPSILPSLKESSFFKAYQVMIKDLLESSYFVKEGGHLLFINHSLDQEETKQVIHTFLSQRKDYVLVKDRIIYPGEKDSDGGYFALLERKKKAHD